MIHGPSTLISIISETIATRCENGSVAMALAAAAAAIISATYVKTIRVIRLESLLQGVNFTC